MKKMKIIHLLILSISIHLIGCESTTDTNKIITYSPFPIEPSWVDYTRKPVINSYKSDNDEENYIISDELMKKSLQMQDYLDRIKKWKSYNSIP